MSITVETTADRTVYRRNGLVHRDDGPAIDSPGRIQEWYEKDKLHRIGGPAVIYWNGPLFCGSRWFYRGKQHREDGPAVELLYGSKCKEYWIDGEEVQLGLEKLA
jgi:hypothetical protein